MRFSLCLVCVPAPLLGQEMEWQAAAGNPGDWHEAANWDTATPDVFFSFTIDNGGVAQFADGSAVGSWGWLGGGSGGTLDQSGGTLTLGDLERGDGGMRVRQLGTYRLSGGTGDFSSLWVGFTGEGSAAINGGELIVGDAIIVGHSGTGRVTHQGGAVTGRNWESSPRSSIDIGVSDGEGIYELNDGQIRIGEINLRNGQFLQTNGDVIAGSVRLRGTASHSALYQMDGGQLRGRITVESSASHEAANFDQTAGIVHSTFISVSNGSYRMSGGTVWSPSIQLGATSPNDTNVQGAFIQTGGSVLTGFLNLDAQSSRSAKSDAMYLLQDATFETASLRINSEDDSSAVFQQVGGTAHTSRLRINSSRDSGGTSVFHLKDGYLLAQHSLVVGEDERSSPAVIRTMGFDFGGSEALIETGIGSYVQFAGDASIMNGQLGTLRIGPDSVLVLNGAFHPANHLRSLEHENLVVQHAEEPFLTIGPGQRANLAGLDHNGGLVVEGFAYDAQTRGSAVFQGQLQVNVSGRLSLGGQSRVAVSGVEDAGIFGGAVDVHQLTVEARSGEGRTDFTIDSGKLHVLDRLRIRTSSNVASVKMQGGEIDAKSMALQGAGAEYIQTGGDARFGEFHVSSLDEPGLGSIARSRAEIWGGTLTTSNFTMAHLAEFDHRRGTVVADRMVIGDGSDYELSGGELKITNELVIVENQSINLDNRDATLSLEGAMLFAHSTLPFRNAKNATLSIDEHSLVITNGAFNLNGAFGTVNNNGFMHRRNRPLTIPAEREIRGTGSLGDVAPRVTIHGKLIAGPTEGDGLRLNRFHVEPGAEVDLGNGGAWSFTPRASTISGGQMRAGALTVDFDATFTQTAGDATFDTLIIRRNATYQLFGGTLTIEGKLDDGRIDFGEFPSSLIAAEGAVVELDSLELIDANGASYVGQNNSLTVVSSDFVPENVFAQFSTTGMLHVRGQVLSVEEEHRLQGPIYIQDGIDNRGVISASYPDQIVEVRGDYRQDVLGKLEIEIEGHPRNPAGGLEVSGHATLGGTLLVSLAEGFRPTVFEEYEIVTAQSFSGEFDELFLPPLVPSLEWAVTQTDTSISLQIVPQMDRVSMADFNDNGLLDAADIDQLTLEQISGLYNPRFDLNGDLLLDAEDRGLWIEYFRGTQVGDSNLDGRFDSTDLVAVFQAGEYEDGIEQNSGWAEGDWNGDRDFTSGDLVTAFAEGGYEQATPAAANPVPEPSMLAWAGALAIILAFDGRRRRRSA